MKKLLSLLTLLVVAISASAASYIPTTVQTISTNTLVLPKDLAGTETWITIPSKTLSDKGLNPTTWDSDFGTQPTKNVKCLQVKTDGGVYNSSKRVIHMLVTGISGVKAIGQANSGRGFQIGATEYIAGTTTESTAMNVVAGSSEALNPVSCTDLDASKTYIISIFAYSSDTYLYGVYFTAGTVKTVATQAFAGVKQGDATLTENTDYTVDGTTITLTNSATMAPEDIKLINHITYTDESTADTDVDVTLEKNEAGDYFEGTTTIGLTTYTVKVPVDDTPTLEADQTALAVISPKAVAGTATFNLTGANLAGSEVSLAFASAVEGLTVSPASITVADGAVEQAVTVSYVSDKDVAETVVNLVVSTDGVSDIVIPVTYSSTAAVLVEQEDVTGAATWDWAEATGDGNALPAAITNTDVLLANVNEYGASFTPGATFNAANLLVNAQYAWRNANGSKFLQGTTISFNTTVAGKVTIEYANTGNNAARTVNVNGTKGTKSSDVNDTYQSEEFSVEAGAVEIKGVQVSDDADKMLRFRKVVFTPTSESISIPEEGVATYVTKHALDFSTQNGAFKAYVPTGVNAAKTSVATVEVTKVPAGTALLLKGAQGNYDVEIAESAEAPAANIFQVSDGTVTGADDIFAYSKSAMQFKKVATTVTIPAGKCYLQIAGISGDALDLNFEGEATAVEAIAEANAEAAAPVKVIKNGKLYIGSFNVAGQQVK